MAPAMQEVFGDFAAFCQYSRVSGLFMQHFQNTAGPDGFRERGSKRLNDLIGPVTFPECPGSWLTCAASSLHSSCISWPPYRAMRLAACIAVLSIKLPRSLALTCWPWQSSQAGTAFERGCSQSSDPHAQDGSLLATRAMSSRQPVVFEGICRPFSRSFRASLCHR